MIQNFKVAYDAYMRCFDLGSAEQSVAYPLGKWHLLQEDYYVAAEWFVKCLSCGEELMASVIYWQYLCGFRAESHLESLKHYQADMNIGYHTAYQTAVSLFGGETDVIAVFDILE